LEEDNTTTSSKEDMIKDLGYHITITVGPGLPGRE